MLILAFDDIVDLEIVISFYYYYFILTGLIEDSL